MLQLFHISEWPGEGRAGWTDNKRVRAFADAPGGRSNREGDDKNGRPNDRRDQAGRPDQNDIANHIQIIDRSSRRGAEGADHDDKEGAHKLGFHLTLPLSTADRLSITF